MLERDVVRVCVEALSVQTYLGIHDFEQEKPRDVYVDVQFDYARPKEDQIEAGIDYRWVRDAVLTSAQGGRFGLLEILAETILKAVTAEPRMLWVSVRVHKMAALRQAKSVTALVEWKRT